MKTITCKQLGGACDFEFKASSFEEAAQLSQAHGKDMYAQKDAAHLEVMKAMEPLMADPIAMKQWMGEKKRLFESLAEHRLSNGALLYIRSPSGTTGRRYSLT